MTQTNQTIRIAQRDIPPRATWVLQEAGVHPLLARLYAARGVRGGDELDTRSAVLLSPTQLKGTTEAACLLADAIAAKKRLLIVADYDCDGATACAVGLRALRMMGATVDYLVPDRFKLGYGLSPEVARLAAERRPDVVITVDNGIASIEGVAELKARGIATLITDHHLPGAELPVADVIVNPNQPGCTFPSKALAGVGVMFYVALALRAELRQRGAFGQGRNPIWPVCWILSHWAPWPMWSRWITTIVFSSRRGLPGCVQGTCRRVCVPCLPLPGASQRVRPRLTWVSCWGRDSMRQAG
jgi:single-stranded-DNA-specific exonuclease